jgi:hypothetical protein
MAERRPEQASLVVESDQPLIAVPLEENGRAVEQYFVEQPLSDVAGSEQSIQEALSLGGVWSDLDWEDMERELYRIGHENPPTPPIDEL